MNDQWTEFLAESKLRIFDFDDTLVKTDATIKVTDPDGKTISMTPAEFATHELNDSNRINIVLVGTSDPAAKANWIENKIVDGATDILFLDDSGKNVRAVLGLKNKYPDVKIDARVSNYGEELAEGIMNEVVTSKIQ